ncbi:MAG: hypothetical protein RL596_2431 [Bacteroidota bacterium]|jgi:hypothetical protein
MKGGLLIQLKRKLVLKIAEYQIIRRPISHNFYFPFYYNQNNTGLIVFIDNNTSQITEAFISEIKSSGISESLIPPAEEIISNTFQKQNNKLTGSISFYKVNKTFLAEIGFKGGNQIFLKATKKASEYNTSVIRSSGSKNSDAIKSNGCTYYYLITYWSDGTVDRTFIGFSCDGGGAGSCEQTRVISRDTSITIKRNCSGNNNSGGGDNSLIEEAMITFFKPDNIIQNILDYIKCFSSGGSKYKVAIVVDQPVPGTSQLNGSSGSGSSYGSNAGHTFLVFTQVNQDGSETTRNIGFYPQENANPVYKVSPSILNNDENHSWNIGLEVTMSYGDFSKSLNSIVNSTSRQYDLDNNNCTTVALKAMEKGGMDIFTPMGSKSMFGGLLTFNGYNPADLGQTIFNMYINPMYQSSVNLKKITPPTDARSNSSHPNTGTCQ